MTTWNLRGKVAVVTGGSRGIGRAIADALLAAGCEVHIFDVGDPPDGPLMFHRVDITKPEQVEAAAQLLPRRTTLLVNNAGITRDKSVLKMSDDEWGQVLAVNLTGAFNVTRAVGALMRDAGVGGRIVNITSINGLRGKFGQANYAASKAGLIGFTKTLARELGSKGITVNCVAPGMVMTEMAEKLPEDIRKRARDEAVLGTLAEPIDIANAVLFLLSDEARMITGEVLRVDAGQYL